MNWKRLLPYLFGFGTATSGSLVAIHQGWLGGSSGSEQYVAEAAELVEDSVQMVGTETDSIEEEVYRTSEQPNEKSTQHVRSFSPKPPKDGFRVGCICMDGDRQENKGGGACAGHGGVRFWLYQLPNGSLLEHPTDRHADHPEPLSETEMKNLVGAGRKKKENAAAAGGIGMYEVLFGLMICVTIGYAIKVWWQPST